MNINDAYPSKYLKASDLPDEGSQVVTIEKIGLEEVGKQKETKVVIYFAEFDRGFVCNKTNARSIARIHHSEEFDDWVGKRIALYRTEVEFAGEMTEGIRVKATKIPAKPATPLKKTVPDSDDDDDIPF